MTIADRIRQIGRTGPKSINVNTPFHEVVETNAVGGVPPKRFSTIVHPVFHPHPDYGVMNSGIGPRIAYAPPRAPMLQSSDFHSNIIQDQHGMVRNTKATHFSRNVDEPITHSAAVSEATHVSGDTHATVRRRILRGDHAVTG